MFDYKGYGEEFLTLATEDEKIGGKPMTVSGENTVSLSKSGEKFFGIGVTERCGIASVQVGGYVEAGYTGTAPKHGAGYLNADGNGGVTAAQSGVPVTVLKIDSDNAVVGFIF